MGSAISTAGCDGCSWPTPSDIIAITTPRIMCGRGGTRHFPVQDDDYLVGVLRHVERNALRAELVVRAENWRKSAQFVAALARRPARLNGHPVGEKRKARILRKE